MRARKMARTPKIAAALLAAGVAALAAWACSNPDAVGNVVLGTFDFQAELESDGCQFDGGADLPASFTRTLSYDTSTGKAYLTADSQSHVGSLINGWLSVQASARRHMPTPCDCEGSIVETLTGQLIREGTLASCAGLPDGGTPGPDDAGVAAPSDAGLPGYDLLCSGTIVDAFKPDDVDGGCPSNAGCHCEGCEIRYRVTGMRQ